MMLLNDTPKVSTCLSQQKWEDAHTGPQVMPGKEQDFRPAPKRK
jgi:hypothetical protein